MLWDKICKVKEPETDEDSDNLSHISPPTSVPVNNDSFAQENCSPDFYFQSKTGDNGLPSYYEVIKNDQLNEPSSSTEEKIDFQTEKF